MKKNIFLLLSLLLFFCSFSQETVVNWETKQLSQSELSNVSVLSECYGYIRFFYPNPHTKDFDWMKFLTYAVSKIEKVDNDSNLKKTLLALFLPICPQISFSTDSLVSSKLLPPYFIVEHKGIGNYKDLVFGKKYSSITRRTEDAGYQNIYSYKLKENLYANFPIAVKELSAKTKEFAQLEKEINKQNKYGVSLFTALFNKKKVVTANVIFEQPAYRMADVIVRQNFVRHFYPYFLEDELAESWEMECTKAIKKMAAASSMYDYYKETRRLLANVKDSHVNVWVSYVVGKLVATYIPHFYPDVSFAFTNDVCYVDFVGENYDDEIKHGDVVCSINGVPIENAVQQKLLETPHSTISSGLYAVSVYGKLLECAKKDSVFEITVKSSDNIEKTVHLKASLRDAPFHWKNDFIRQIADSLVYINLCTSTCTYEDFAKEIPVIQKSKGVIFDLRGYPSYDVLSIISHFITEKIEMGNLLEPVYRFPNQENVKYNIADKWAVFPASSSESKEASKKYQYKEPRPIQIDKRVMFLINEKTVSFGETFAEMMKFYNIGTMVGTNTAGCNGDMTVFYLPCYSFTMTYNKFLNRDGSQHHSIGVLPDIHCEMQILDIQQNIDTQLEKTKRILR